MNSVEWLFCMLQTKSYFFGDWKGLPCDRFVVRVTLHSRAQSDTSRLSFKRPILGVSINHKGGCFNSKLIPRRFNTVGKVPVKEDLEFKCYKRSLVQLEGWGGVQSRKTKKVSFAAVNDAFHLHFFINYANVEWQYLPNWVTNGTDHIPSNFLKAVFHKFYLVHSLILCPKYNQIPLVF